MNYSSSLVLVNFNPNHLVHSCNPQLPSRQLTGLDPYITPHMGLALYVALPLNRCVRLF